MVTEVPGCQAVNSSLNGDAPFYIFEFIQPLLIRIATQSGKIVPDFHFIDVRLKANYFQAAERWQERAEKRTRLSPIK